MAGGGDVGSSYSPPVAFIFVFNLIVGVGALALPYGFLAAGWVNFSNYSKYLWFYILVASPSHSHFDGSH